MQGIKNIISAMYPGEEFSDQEMSQMAYEVLRFFRICLGDESDFIK